MPAKPLIDYYFAPMSGYAYLGHARLLQIAAEVGADVIYHPLDMAQVFAAAGSFPPAKYPAVRQHHRKADMQRWAQKFGLPINVTPKYWPTPMALACQVIMAGGTVGVDQGDISLAVLSAVWVHDLNIADPDDMAQGLKVAGLPAEPLLRAAATADVISAAQIETAKGIDIGIFGSPTYVVDGEWFFGQDRLAFLQDRLNLR